VEKPGKRLMKDFDLFVGHPDGIFRSLDMGKTWHRVHAGFGNVLHASKFESSSASAVRKCLNFMFPAMYYTLW
jgi:hypothetical protein